LNKGSNNVFAYGSAWNKLFTVIESIRN